MSWLQFRMLLGSGLASAIELFTPAPEISLNSKLGIFVPFGIDLPMRRYFVFGSALR